MTNAAERQTATLLVEGFGRLEPREVTRDCTIGRDPRSGVPIDHPTVSRHHARIALTARGWTFIDLGSQNGSVLNGKRVHGEAPLTDRAELHIGRVRAWFFTGDRPAGWRPDDMPQQTGKLIRCRCGHIGWAPGYAAGMTLTCVACGRDLVISGNLPAAPKPAVAPRTCAACHTDIAPGEASHECPECATTMHADCWRDNHGCATYGCPQVNLETADTSASVEPQPLQAAVPAIDEPDDGPISRPAWGPSLVQVAAATLLGLPTFGIPGIALGAYRLVAGDERREGPRRFAWIALGFAAGVVGFSTSFWWWFER